MSSSTDERMFGIGGSAAGFQAGGECGIPCFGETAASRDPKTLHMALNTRRIHHHIQKESSIAFF